MLTDRAPPRRRQNVLRLFYLCGKIRIFCQPAGYILVERKMRKQKNNINSIAAQAKSPLALHQRARFFERFEKKGCVVVRQQAAVFIEEIGDELICRQ